MRETVTNQQGLSELVKSSNANMAKRAIVRYLFPRNPERSVKRHHYIGSPIFRKVIMGTVGRIYGKSTRKFYGPSNYKLNAYKGRMESAADFATKGSVFNEAVHTLAAVPGFMSAYAEVVNNSPELLSMNKLPLVINLGCVAVQRYNRARISQYLDRRLKRGAEFEPGYENWLHIDNRSIPHVSDAGSSAVDRESIIARKIST